MSTEQSLRIEGVTLSRGTGRRALVVLRDVDLEVGPSQVIGVSGPSGAGKSSLIGLLSGELTPSSGRIELRFDGARGTPRAVRRLRPGSIALVAQDPVATLDSLWTIRRSVAEPLRAARLPRGEAVERVRRALDAVGLDHLPTDRHPHEISIGQAQRVCIARALAARPALILADEPTSALDVITAARVADLLRGAAAQGSSIVIVSHNPHLLDAVSHQRYHLTGDRLQPIG